MPGKLTYFGIGGRAEPIRALLHFANHEFEDNRVSQDDFATLKASLPLGSLPVWEEDGETIAQSAAILRMLGIRYGMYSTEANICWNIDSLIDFMEENFNDMLTYCMKPLLGAPVEDADKQKYEGYFEKMIPFLNARCESHDKKWIAGTDHFTIADLKVYQGMLMSLEIESNPAPADVKEAMRQKIAQHPKLQHYLSELTAHMQPWIAARVPTPV